MNFSTSFTFAERIAELIPNRQFVGYSGAGYFVKKTNVIERLYKKSSKNCRICRKPRAPRGLTFSKMSYKLSQIKEKPLSAKGCIRVEEFLS